MNEQAQWPVANVSRGGREGPAGVLRKAPRLTKSPAVEGRVAIVFGCFATEKVRCHANTENIWKQVSLAEQLLDRINKAGATILVDLAAADAPGIGHRCGCEKKLGMVQKPLRKLKWIRYDAASFGRDDKRLMRF